MKKKFTLLLTIFILTNVFSQGTWTQKTSFPGSARQTGVGFSIGCKGYVGTGYNGGIRLDDFYEYNPATDTWTLKAPYGGGGIDYAAGIVIGNKGYIGTGYCCFLNLFWEFDPSGNNWAQKTNFAGAGRASAGGFGIGNYGYIGAGWDGTLFNDYWKYDPSGNSWTQVASLPASGRVFQISMAINGKGYVGLGGENFQNYKKDFWEYDPGLNTWLQRADFPGTAREGASAFVIGTKGYVGLGYDGFLGSEVPYNDFYEFDPATNVWTQVADFGGVKRYYAASFAIGGKGYISCGLDIAHVMHNDLWEFIPAGGVVGGFGTLITSPNITICSGSSTQLSASGLISYSWSPAVGLNTTSGSIVITGVTSTTTYSVSGIDNCGSFATGPIMVTVALPTLITTPSSVICIGDTIVLGAIGATSYTWHPSTGLSKTTGNSVKASPVTTTTYSITGVDGGGCMNTYSVNISVNPLPSLFTSGNVSICFGNDAVLSATGNAGSYSWMPGIFLNSTTGVSVLVSPTLAGTYSYSVFATDLATTCSSKNNMKVTVLPNPIVVASNNIGICPGISTNLSVMNNAVSIVWTPSTGLNNNTSTNVTASPTITTTYTVTGTDVYGCTTSDAVMVTVSAVLIANAGNDVSICKGSSTTLTASGGSTYSWLPTESLSIIAIYAIASPTTTTTYTLSIISPCLSTPDYITITVFYLPTITVSSNVTICEGSPTPLTASGATTYSWNPDVSINPNVDSTLSVSPLTTTIYTVTGTDVNGCSSHNTIMVDVDPLSPVNAGPDVTINLGDVVTLSPTAVAGATYSWSPSDNLSCTNCQNPTANPPNTTMYVLTVNEGACTLTDTVVVYVKCNDVFVPNAFSPNGDGYNDVLYVKSVCITSLTSFAIYDRWGEKVFETTDITKGWDGKLGNTELLPQVFVYFIEASGTNDEPISKKGNISLYK